MQIKEIGEEGIIKAIKNINQAEASQVLIGIGDDAAVVRPEAGMLCLYACHMLVENSHFLLSKSTPFQIGYKGVSKSVADIEAMGATSRFLLVGISMSPDTPAQFIRELYEGIYAANAKGGISVIGGDISDCRGPLTISLTIIGEAAEEHLTPIDGAQEGDVLVVTGPLGAAAAGLHLLLNDITWEKYEAFREVMQQQLQPEPPWGKGQTLARSTAVTAMTDISDSLTHNLQKICKASKKGALLELKDLPVSHSARVVADKVGCNVLEWVLNGGEDFELLACVRPEKLSRVQELMKQESYNIYPIGRIIGEPGLYIKSEGEIKAVSPQGFDHFR
ncbi:MAG: thiamine-phosphate kinase [Syntrophomonadaceae bacterium]|jgi:thiamine-monophosphate kinase|nr:thiamine-phosphate kinase [Syntrophomonadaceae bacterium]